MADMNSQACSLRDNASADAPIAFQPGAFAGFREAFPVFLALFPIGASFGTLAVQIGMPPLAAVAMSFCVFAGAAQFMALGMLSAGASPVEIIVATFIVNIRNFVSGLAILDRIPHLSPRVKIALAHAITDESCALIGIRANADGALSSPAFVASAMYTIVAGWVAGTAVGSSFSYLIPKSVTQVMGIGIVTMFICLLVPRIKQVPRYGFIAGAAALLNLCLREWLTGGWALVTSAVIAASMMIVIERDDKQ
jgi:4-azaleucine resistance transporter AzlC